MSCPSRRRKRALFYVMNYREFLQGLQLRHFSPSEILKQGERKRGDVTNSLPPPELFPRIVPTLWVADMLRERLGYPLTITSAYRSEAYNQAVSGASRSSHLRNEALDIIPRGNVDELWLAAMELRNGGAFKGGIGRYHAFVHIDTRGVNRSWGVGV